jgi:alkylation response protein AidB-like acyl-CoA dehydrogenase
LNPLLDERLQSLRAAAQVAAQERVAPVADAIDASGRIPRELFSALGRAGLLVPEVGAPDPLVRVSLVAEQLARKSAALAVVAAGHAVATHALRAGGADPGSVSLAELEEGAKLATVLDGARLEVAGEGSAARLSGEAELVAGATLADLIVVPLGSAGLFALEADDEGVTIEAEDALLGLNGAGTGSMQLDDAKAVRIGDAALAAATSDWLRIGLSAVAVGLARAALDVAVADLVERREAGDRADRSQAIQWMLADIATEAEAARAATWYAACESAGPARSEASAMCRLLSAEAAVGASRRAVQILGPRGILRSAGAERLYRDAKQLEIQGGTNEEQLARIAHHLLPDLAPGA